MVNLGSSSHCCPQYCEREQMLPILTQVFSTGLPSSVSARGCSESSFLDRQLFLELTFCYTTVFLLESFFPAHLQGQGRKPVLLMNLQEYSITSAYPYSRVFLFVNSFSIFFNNSEPLNSSLSSNLAISIQHLSGPLVTFPFTFFFQISSNLY